MSGSPPTIGEPRATGPKNGGVSSYECDVVRPVTTIRGADFAPGKQLEFRMRSTSTRWINWRESKLLVRYKVAFGPDPIITDKAAVRYGGLGATAGIGTFNGLPT